MKVLARTKGMLWRGAEWLVVTLGLSWFLIWACTRRRRAWPEPRHGQHDHPLRG